MLGRKAIIRAKSTSPRAASEKARTRVKTVSTEAKPNVKREEPLTWKARLDQSAQQARR